MPPPRDEKEPHPTEHTAAQLGGGTKTKKRIKILLQVQLQQEMDRVETGVGLQENQRQLQGV